MHAIRHEMRSGTTPRLTVLQTRALLYIRRHPGTSLGDLAAHLGIGASTCSVLVDRLVRDGLVERAVDPEERRRIRLSPTELGSAVVAEARDQTRGWLRERLALLPPAEVVALERAMLSLETATVGHPSVAPEAPAGPASTASPEAPGAPLTPPAPLATRR